MARSRLGPTRPEGSGGGWESASTMGCRPSTSLGTILSERSESKDRRRQDPPREIWGWAVIKIVFQR